MGFSENLMPPNLKKPLSLIIMFPIPPKTDHEFWCEKRMVFRHGIAMTHVQTFRHVETTWSKRSKQAVLTCKGWCSSSGGNWERRQATDASAKTAGKAEWVWWLKDVKGLFLEYFGYFYLVVVQWPFFVAGKPYWLWSLGGLWWLWHGFYLCQAELGDSCCRNGWTLEPLGGSKHQPFLQSLKRQGANQNVPGESWADEASCIVTVANCPG